ncbi:protein Teyrha-meyrha-like isoform X2 [Ceratina calcarata]|uniref:Protein Teyrha-meyrha-like isoform X2 n=1 Tax=Ceratina calcarata TaxID=156304 RepID=A0AAJ7WGG7_9HYME|nr:protein Teyrha-meyrha-like isoform X2 [Ceratina calcarata]
MTPRADAFVAHAATLLTQLRQSNGVCNHALTPSSPASISTPLPRLRLRLHRHRLCSLGSWVTEAKDLQSFTPTLSYGLHHMLHIPPPFLHPLDHRLPFGSFRPLGPSAFGPPSKCLKIETSSSFSNISSMFSSSSLSSAGGGVSGSNIGGMGPEVGPQSPQGSPNGGSPIIERERGQINEEEERETPGSENTERSTPEEGRPYRLGPVFGGRCAAEALGLGLGLAYRFALPPGLAAKCCLEQAKKKYPSDFSCCPVCGVSVRPQELEHHFAQELDRLFKISANSRNRMSRSNLIQGHNSQDHPGRGGGIIYGDGTPQGRWETYKRIRANRQARIRIKNRKRKAGDPCCPVCNDRSSGTPEELNQRVENTYGHQLNKQNNNCNATNVEEEEIDVEGDSETVEEYEWSGQRVRAGTMLVGGFSAASLATSSTIRSSTSNPQEDDEIDLIVDGDTTDFGSTQYSESDTITLQNERTFREHKEREAQREAVMSPNNPQTPEQSGRTSIEIKNQSGRSQSSIGMRSQNQNSIGIRNQSQSLMEIRNQNQMEIKNQSGQSQNTVKIKNEPGINNISSQNTNLNLCINSNLNLDLDLSKDSEGAKGLTRSQGPGGSIEREDRRVGGGDAGDGV